MHSHKRGERGFTIMEMMVAFLLTLVAVLSLIGIFPAGITSIQQSSDSVQAQGIAQQITDAIRDSFQTSSNLPAGITAGTAYDCTPRAEQPLLYRGVTQQPTNFSCTVNVQNVVASGQFALEHRIDVVITWTTQQRGTETRTYESYVVN